MVDICAKLGQIGYPTKVSPDQAPVVVPLMVITIYFLDGVLVELVER